MKRQPRSRQALAVAALAALVVSGCSGATGESTRADEASTGPISVEVSAGIGAGVVEALAEVFDHPVRRGFSGRRRGLAGAARQGEGQ